MTLPAIGPFRVAVFLLGQVHKKTIGQHLRANPQATGRFADFASALVCVCLVLATGCSEAMADDIDVYTAKSLNGNKPNVAFVLDFSGSMEDDVYGNSPSTSGLPSKIDTLKAAMNTVLDENIDKINAGIGSVFNGVASGNRWPVTELSADASTIDPSIPAGQFTVRDIIVKQYERHEAIGATNTVAALAEAAIYLRGGPVMHDGREAQQPLAHEPEQWDVVGERYWNGNSEASLAVSYTPADTAYARGVNEPGNFDYCWNEDCDGLPTYDCDTHSGETGPSADGSTPGNGTRCKYPHADAWRGATYISPIVDSCQATAIVLISDGEPTINITESVLQETLGHDDSSCEDLSESIFTAGPGGKQEGNCGPEIVKMLATSDQITAIPGSVVSTFTVGFDVDGPGKSYLQRLAEDGNGSFFEANATDELVDAISEAINEIGLESQSFSQFSLDVDRASYSNDNRAFFSLFKPASGPVWSGNIKGYFIEPEGIVDTLGQPAVELIDNTFQFAGAARSFWSSSTDGDIVTAGGASEIITTQGTRKLLTYVGGSIPPSGVALTPSTDHLLQASNPLITNSMMGLPAGSALRQTSLDWLQTAPMGDPLHTLSVRVEYDTRTVLYAMTNQGLLHAIDASDPTALNDHSAGSELFAFMPQRLLSNLPAIMDPVRGDDHIYGLDGGLTRWHDDANEDGIVNGSEKVLLVFGMRRGGNAYYALDVSNPMAPSLEWMIDSGSTGFSDLAQSWSKPSLISVNHAGVKERMLIFGGGYDADTLDDTNTQTPASGNAIYMVDKSGTLQWSVTSTNHANMQYSIVSDLTPLDIDANGQVDRIYAGDLGGQVWRIDLDDINDEPVVSRFADFSNTGYHPFFYAPSVAANKHGRDQFLSVTLGSGNRTDPLNETSNNSLFMIRDTNMEPIDSTDVPETIALSQLYDATDNHIGSSDTSISDTAKDALELAKGWKIDFDSGEKSLSRIVTFEDTILATTFDTDSTNTDDCSLATISRLYTVSIKTGEPIQYLSDGSLSQATHTADERITELMSAGIASSPVIVFRADNGNADVYVDREKISSVSGQLRTIYWHAR